MSIVTELLEKVGYTSIWVATIGIGIQFIAKPVFEAFMDIHKEKKKSQNQSQLDRENKIQESILEFETVKKDKVLPSLENIALIIEDYIKNLERYEKYILYFSKPNNIESLSENCDYNYINTELKSLNNRLKAEKRVFIYLPKEIRFIVEFFEGVLSAEYFDEDEINNFFTESYMRDRIKLTLIDSDTHEVRYRTGFEYMRVLIEYAKDFVEKYKDAFYKLINEYLKINANEKEYKKLVIDYINEFNELTDTKERFIIDCRHYILNF